MKNLRLLPQLFSAVFLGLVAGNAIAEGSRLETILLNAVTGGPLGCEYRALSLIPESLAPLAPNAIAHLEKAPLRLSLPEDRLILSLQRGAEDSLWNLVSETGSEESAFLLSERLKRNEIIRALSGSRVFASDATLSLMSLGEIVQARSFFSAREKESYSDAIAIYESMPQRLQMLVVLRQQFAFCLNRRNQDLDRIRAIKVLEGTLAEGDAVSVSESWALLARIQKDYYDESLKRGEDPSLRLNYLVAAKDNYLKAFQFDPMSFYAGGNAVELMLELGTGPMIDEAFATASFVKFALRYHKPLETTDYWVLATALQLEMITQNWELVTTLVQRALAQPEPAWMFKTTLASLRRVERSFRSQIAAQATGYKPEDLEKVQAIIELFEDRIVQSVPLVEPTKSSLTQLSISPPSTGGLMLDKDIDLKEEARLSSFGDHISALEAHSRGVITIHDYLRRFQANAQGGYLLGLTSEGHRPVYEALANYGNLDPWWLAYQRFGLDGDSEVGMSAFMQQISDEGKPVVFMVPRNLFAVQTASNHTAREMDWILRDPRRAANFSFVLGGYQVYQEEFVTDLVKRRAYQPSVDFLSTVLRSFAARLAP